MIYASHGRVDIDIGAEVWALDGRLLGRVQSVVVDPERRVATHLVVRLGELFAVDKVVPVRNIRTVEDHRIRLAIGPEELVRMPDLDERAFVSLRPQGEATPEAEEMTYWVTGEPVALPALYAEPDVEPYAVEEWRNVPEDSVVLKEGLPVRTRGGELVGSVDELVTDPQTGAVTHLVLRWSGNPRHDKAIPVVWVGRSDEETGIILLAGRSQIEALPDYHVK